MSRLYWSNLPEAKRPRGGTNRTISRASVAGPSCRVGRVGIRRAAVLFPILGLGWIELHRFSFRYTIEMYIKERSIHVLKWGNSLAVRLPPAGVDALYLKEIDLINIRISPDRALEVIR